ncbi:hypothetical protein FOVG_17517 [Fusarium oxysporum f. sp. pisi HDV247]|uniref:Uncharacterized protein n=1 Tax=Fusarium oxysporum f. sp. pisi HDV247 TaxID=1080344 RepID=W9NES7_FUSOX|nr:hypothetical protein FOVG_17517 [Fusarium oxysporum f. sp. pisi HDV247]
MVTWATERGQHEVVSHARTWSDENIGCGQLHFGGRVKLSNSVSKTHRAQGCAISERKVWIQESSIGARSEFMQLVQRERRCIRA